MAGASCRMLVYAITLRLKCRCFNYVSAGSADVYIAAAVTALYRPWVIKMWLFQFANYIKRTGAKMVNRPRTFNLQPAKI